MVCSTTQLQFIAEQLYQNRQTFVYRLSEYANILIEFILVSNVDCHHLDRLKSVNVRIL